MTIAEYYPNLETYLSGLKGVKVDYNEWQWKRFLIGGKPFCAFCNEGTSKPFIVVKCEVEFNELMRSAYKGLIKPAPNLNKYYWSAVTPDLDITYDVIKKMCYRGYKLVLSKLPEKERTRILEM